MPYLCCWPKIYINSVVNQTHARATSCKLIRPPDCLWGRRSSASSPQHRMRFARAFSKVLVVQLLCRCVCMCVCVGEGLGLVLVALRNTNQSILPFTCHAASASSRARLFTFTIIVEQNAAISSLTLSLSHPPLSVCRCSCISSQHNESDAAAPSRRTVNRNVINLNYPLTAVDERKH